MSYQYRNIPKHDFYSKEDNSKRDEIINILKLYKEKFFDKNKYKKSKKIELPKLAQSKSFQKRILKNISESKKKNESKIFVPTDTRDAVKYIISPYRNKKFNNNDLNKILTEKKIQKKNKSQKNIVISEKKYWNKENKILSNYKINSSNNILTRNFSMIKSNYNYNNNSNTYSFWNKKLLFRNKNKNGDIYDLINISNKYTSTLNKLNNNLK